MKIRTITTGITLHSISDREPILIAGQFNGKAKKVFEEACLEVQTTRIATNSWEEYTVGLTDTKIPDEIQRLDNFCQRHGISFFSIGFAQSPERLKLIPEIIKRTSALSCSAGIGNHEKGIDFENAKLAAGIIRRISEETENGYGNFRFCAWSNCKAGIPFFPVSYHEGARPAFAIGLECGDLAMKAFSEAGNFRDAERFLKELFEEELGKVNRIAMEIAGQSGMEFTGIDSSLAPSLQASESIALAYEKLGLGEFGLHGTLAISAMITRVLKNLSIKTCGYSGLMLPVCEDAGLVARAGNYNLSNLLLYSTVCGCGLDTVPLPGNISVHKLEAILLDMASLANKLNKPLSARLLPVPGKESGEMTHFNSPYLLDCKIFNVE